MSEVEDKVEDVAEDVKTEAVDAAELAPDVHRAELYISTIRLIDAVTDRGAIKGGELLAVGAIRQKFVEWLVENGFVNQEQAG